MLARQVASYINTRQGPSSEHPLLLHVDSYHMRPHEGLCHTQALSSSQAYIFEERDRLLQLQAENDELRLQEVEDRHRLEHLLALLDAQKCHKASAAARKDKDIAVVNELSAPDVDILRTRIEFLQSQLTEQVGTTKALQLWKIHQLCSTYDHLTDIVFHRIRYRACAPLMRVGALANPGNIAFGVI